MDCAGVPSEIGDLVWVESLIGPDTGDETMVFSGSGASGTFDATADSHLPNPPGPVVSSAQHALDSNICNNTRLNQTYRYTFDWHYSINVDAGAFCVVQLFAYDCSLTSTAIFNVTLFAGTQVDSGTTNYDVIVPPCGSCNLHLYYVIQTFGGTAHADSGGTFTIVKL